MSRYNEIQIWYIKKNILEDFFYKLSLVVNSINWQLTTIFYKLS